MKIVKTENDDVKVIEVDWIPIDVDGHTCLLSRSAYNEGKLLIAHNEEPLFCFEVTNQIEAKEMAQRTFKFYNAIQDKEIYYGA